MRKNKWASLRDLEVFLTVMQERKVTAAAERLGISQPAISRTLAQMEEKSGKILFRREGQGIAPTADALVLYEKLLPVFAQLGELDRFPEAPDGPATLRLACPPTLAHAFVEGALSRFLACHPGVRVSLDIVTTPEVLALVSEQRVDLGLADVQTPQAGVMRTVFRKSALVCVLPEKHELAAQPEVGLTDLQDQPLILLGRRNPMRSTIERLLEKEGVAPKLRVETSTALSAVSFASHGMGIALVNPFPSTCQLPAGVVTRPFKPALEFETCFYTSSDTPPAVTAQRFMEFVREHQPPALLHSVPVP